MNQRRYQYPSPPLLLSLIEEQRNQPKQHLLRPTHDLLVPKPPNEHRQQRNQHCCSNSLQVQPQLSLPNEDLNRPLPPLVRPLLTLVDQDLSDRIDERDSSLRAGDGDLFERVATAVDSSWEEDLCCFGSESERLTRKSGGRNGVTKGVGGGRGDEG